MREKKKNIQIIFFVRTCETEEDLASCRIVNFNSKFVVNIASIVKCLSHPCDDQQHLIFIEELQHIVSTVSGAPLKCEHSINVCSRKRHDLIWTKFN